MRAVRKHTDCRWLLLYIERWLKAPAERADGTRVARTVGTPQGGVVSPLLANIFPHHAFDTWMAETCPHVPFERYADDVVVHCRSEAQARFIRDKIVKRLAACRLEAHPDKTKIVYSVAMMTDRASILTSHSTFWATRFVPVPRRIATGSSS